jgi:glycosyltransferase involved in cell wall biosynthesis
VGSISDLPFPQGDLRFRHIDPVDQAALRAHYAAADAMILASREEGLALVQPQAMATGLPLLCTERTGGADLGHTPALAARILEVPPDDVDALARGIEAMRARVAARAFPPLADADRRTLSWQAYGERYSAALEADLGAATDGLQTWALNPPLHGPSIA